MRGASTSFVVVVLAIGVFGGARMSAHRLDECLQAARIAVEPDRVELELDVTPGAAVAESILSDIDRDRNGVLSPDEQRAYVKSLLAAIEVAVDGRRLPLDSGGSTFADVAVLERGEGTIQVRSSAALPSLPEGRHQVFFRNAYRRDVSVYLANALVPESDRVAVTSQRHDAEQQELTIDYTLQTAPTVPMMAWLLAGIGIPATAVALKRRGSTLTKTRSHRFVVTAVEYGPAQEAVVKCLHGLEITENSPHAG